MYEKKKIAIIFIFIFIYLKYLLKNNKALKSINIAYSLNNNYIYPVMVSITSILINSKNNTFIQFHLLITNNFKLIHIRKFLSLKKVKSNCKFRFYKIEKHFKGWIHGRNKTISAFFRIFLGEIIYSTDKIIYLDGDTLIYNDLTEMYELNMDNLYFRGIYEIFPRFRGKNHTSICDGVMLINIKLIREEKLYKKFKKYYFYYYNKGIYYGDQFILNNFFYHKIGYLPAKYGIFFINKEKMQLYRTVRPIIYSQTEILDAINNPVIRHLWGYRNTDCFRVKPWKIKKKSKIKEEWNYYARKTGYYYFICKTYIYACKNLMKEQ